MDRLNFLTQDGIPDLISSRPVYTRKVKDALCAIAEIMLDSEISNRADSESVQEVVSESNDGFSVSYARTPASLDSRGRDMQQAINERIYNTAVMYLAQSGLFYRAVGIGS